MIWRAVAVAGLGVLLLGCAAAGPPAGTGDPGNARLHLLRQNGVWAALPPGATAVAGVAETPASWDPVQGGWSGAGVSQRFVSEEPAASVFAYYAGRATSSGWRATGRDGLGYVSTWVTTFAGGIGANLALYYVRGDPHVAGSAVTYLLAGGVDVINARGG